LQILVLLVLKLKYHVFKVFISQYIEKNITLQLITDHEQIKLVFQHIQVDNLMPGPSNRTPDEHHREDHTTLDYF